MTEQRIFELLQNIQPVKENFQINFNEHSKLIPEHVDHISNSIANLLHSTSKESGTAANNKRTNLLRLIRSWCFEDSAHFDVNENNFEYLLDHFKPKKEKDKVDNLLSTLKDDFDDLPSENVLERVRNFYDRYDTKLLEKQARLDYINRLDHDKLGSNDFFVSKANIKLDNIDGFLNNFLCRPTIENVPDIKPDQKICEKSLDISRENKVKFAYALLNLKSDNTIVLLTNVIEEIAFEKIKTYDEIELIKYLWIKTDIGYLPLNLLELFPFLYESPVINVCKELISCSDKTEQFVIIENFKKDQKKLIDKCKVNIDVRFKVINLINELFILSDYDEDILDIVKILNI